MLYLKKKIGQSLLGIWKVEESIGQLASMLLNKEWINPIFDTKSDSRKREILATRILLKELVGEEKMICHLPSGKPYLKDHSFQISISHTKGYVAIVLHPELTMGLDIEQHTNKIFRVRERVIVAEDFIDPANEQVHLLLHWSAKEAMFKYLNTDGVDFRKNLHVASFTPQEQGVFFVSESKTSDRRHFEAHYMVRSDFVLVCLVER